MHCYVVLPTDGDRNASCTAAKKPERQTSFAQASHMNFFDDIQNAAKDAAAAQAASFHKVA
jgi:hypothetical protein